MLPLTTKTLGSGPRGHEEPVRAGGGKRAEGGPARGSAGREDQPGRGVRAGSCLGRHCCLCPRTPRPLEPGHRKKRGLELGCQVPSAK